MRGERIADIQKREIERSTKYVEGVCTIIKIDVSASIDGEEHIREGVLELGEKAVESGEIVHQ
jgi:hypothetical protein